MATVPTTDGVDVFGEADPNRIDHRVMLRDVTWKDFQNLLAMRGENPKPRIHYLDGQLELMSTSKMHEFVKKTFARLVEAYAVERDLELSGFGSWTLESLHEDAGAEADECYMMGPTDKRIADIAIEIWNCGELDELRIYQRIGVPELWTLNRNKSIQVHILRGDHYERSERSGLLPDLDLAHLATFLDRPNQGQAVLDYVDALRSASR